jgi:hypothetical protein
MNGLATSGGAEREVELDSGHYCRWLLLLGGINKEIEVVGKSLLMGNEQEE